jgi:hypothetical protein
MSKQGILSLGTVLFLMGTTPLFSQTGTPDASTEDWRRESEIQMMNITSAYSLDADTQNTLRQELEARLFQQAEYDRRTLESMMKKVEAIKAAGLEDDSDSPLQQELNSEFLATVANAPLNDEQVVKWLEQRIPQAVVSEGRQRYVELRELRMTKMQSDDQDLQRAPGLKVELNRGILENTAQLDPANNNNPLPNGEKEERIYPQMSERARNEGLVVPERGSHPTAVARPETKAELAAQEAEKSERMANSPAAAKRAKGTEQAVIAQPPAPEVRVQIEVPSQLQDARRAPQQPPVVVAPAMPQADAKPIVYAAAPPLDEWEKYVHGLCKKYEFDDAQKTNAFSILKDLRRRANQYRLSRADQFAQAELRTDAKARGDELKNLNRPVDALFDELKQRLESLPTLEQRERAKTAPKSGH